MVTITAETYWKTINALDEFLLLNYFCFESARKPNVNEMFARFPSLFNSEQDCQTFIQLYRSNPTKGLTFLFYRKKLQGEILRLENSKESILAIYKLKRDYLEIYNFFNNISK